MLKSTQKIHSKYKVNFSEIIRVLDENGTDFKELVDKKIAELKKQSKYQDKSAEELLRIADSEVIADGCETMLQDSKLLENLIEENPSVGKKIINAIKKVIDQIRGYFKDYPKLAKTEYGQAVLEAMEKTENDIQALYDKAVAEGIKATNAGVANSETQFSLKPYSEKQKQNWKNSKHIIIYENEKQLNDFINSALTNDNADKIYFGVIDKKLAKAIYSNTGINVDNFNLTLRTSEIRKILNNSHGNEASEKLRGQRSIEKDDFVNIPIIVQSPDEIRLSAKLYEGKPVIEFVKTINGKTTVVCYVSNKHHDLTVQTMYSGQNKKSLATTPSGDNSFSQTSETLSGTASNNIIPDSSEKSNSSSQQNSDRFDDRVTIDDLLDDYGDSDRVKLARAMENLAKNDFERSAIKRYQDNVAKLDAAADELIEVNKKIKELTFTKDADRSQLSKLREQKAKLENKIAWWDKKLITTFETAKPLRDLFARGRKEVERKQKVKSDKRFKDYKDWQKKRAVILGQGARISKLYH